MSAAGFCWYWSLESMSSMPNLFNRTLSSYNCVFWRARFLFFYCPNRLTISKSSDVESFFLAVCISTYLFLLACYFTQWKENSPHVPYMLWKSQLIIQVHSVHFLSSTQQNWVEHNLVKLLPLNVKALPFLQFPIMHSSFSSKTSSEVHLRFIFPVMFCLWHSMYSLQW